MITAYRGRNAVVYVDEDGLVVDPPQTTAAVVDAAYVGPAIVDAHVHLAFGSMAEMRQRGVVAVRDLGAPPALAAEVRGPDVEVAGPLLTAPGGYPSRSWGADGFARFVADAADARRAVKDLDVDLVKVALEPAGGPVPDVATVRAIVGAAHDRGLMVTAHALSEPMVLRALDAGVDELCHMPSEPLSPAGVERIAASGVAVVSTIQCLGGAAPANAKALHEAGVRLVYGTDLGNAGTRPGVDVRELRRLAETGLGMAGALAAATVPIEPGKRARLVLLDADPVVDDTTWERPFRTVW
jgi:imidazolonepropionase-like amidohydrolase